MTLTRAARPFDGSHADDAVLPDETAATTGQLEAVIVGARVLALVYALLAPLHVVMLSGDALAVMPPMAAISAAVCVVASVRVRSASPRQRLAYLMLVCLVPVVNTLTHLGLTRQLEQTTVLMLVVVGIGALNSHRRQVTTLVVLVLSGWMLLIVTVPVRPADQIPHYAVQLGLAAALSAAVFVLRRSVMTRLLLARDAAASQVTELEEARGREALVQQQFAAVFAQSPVGISLADEHGHFVEANEAMCLLLGRDLTQIRGRSSLEFTHPDDRPGHAQLGPLISTSEQGVARVEKRYVRPDGTVRWAWLTIRHMDSPEGKQWTLAHVQDITDRKLVEHELDRVRQGLDAAVQIAHAAQTGADPRPIALQAVVRLVNASTSALLEPAPDADATLVVTAGHGAQDHVGMRVRLDEPSATSHVWRTREPLFASNTASHPLVSQRLLQQSDATSMMWQPIGSDDDALAVLTLAWNDPVAGVSEAERATVAAIGEELGVALHAEQMRLALEQATVTDKLTGLLNRRGWDREVASLIRQSQRDQRPVTLALVDLDHFKRYNDTHGHVAADQALAQFAAAAQDAIRAVDVIARWGGEEFAVALRDTDADHALQSLSRLHAATATAAAEDLTCSIGYAELRATESVAHCLTRVDAALYEAKRAGRNRIHRADATSVAAPPAVHITSS